MSDDKESVRAFVRENYVWDDTEELGDDDSLMGKGVIDSTGVLELVTWLHQKHHILVGDEEMTPGKLDSINKIAALIEEKKKQP